MNRFKHVDVTSVEEAVELLGVGDTRVIAGGTNILPLMKLGVTTPSTLVNVKGIKGINKISVDEAGLHIGALVKINSLTCDANVRRRSPLLATAASTIASPQIRNMATVGGNLTQEPRCWYYRGTHHCWLKGGQMCYAVAGENQKHAIFSEGVCHSVQPSDLAPALIALSAKAEIASHKGVRIIPVEELFRAPTKDSRRLSALSPDELLMRVFIPINSGSGTYVKKMERKVWTFASASIAVWLFLEGGAVVDCRLVLGGVSQIPWRLDEVERFLKGQRLSAEVLKEAVEISTKGARPLKHNAYKLKLTKGVLRQALTGLNHMNESPRDLVG